MISKQQVKFINSLKKNKYRLKYNCFIAEGTHVIQEFINSNFEIKSIFSTKEWHLKYPKIDSTIVSQVELNRISSLKTPPSVLSVVARQEHIYKKNNLKKQKKIILLNSLSDPGNLGSIIRTADWFGISSIYLSEDCVDVYNPKVVQASMGSLARVRVYNEPLKNILIDAKKINIQCYGASLSGQNIYTMKKPNHCIIVFGSESHGISCKIKSFLDNEILIPSKNKEIDSLNVSVSFGIILSEFR